jgi:hypothetical protein
MKRLIAASLVVALTCAATTAEQVVEETSWQELAEEGKLLAGQFQKAESLEGRHALKVENEDGQARTVTVLILDRPKITTVCHALAGEVAYQGMAPQSYLEMWTTYEEGEMVFSRTLAPAGPLQSLTGSSDWRGFVLPLFSIEALGRPRRIELNVVFAGAGSVSLGPVRLLEYSKGESPLPGMMPPADQPFERPEVVGQVSWKELDESGKLAHGQLLEGEAPDPSEQLMIEQAEEGAKTIPVALIEKPGINSRVYQVAGWVKHEEVAPGSYLEMWSTFADGGRYMSRTLAPSGPTRNLDGSSDWRPFALVFVGDERVGPPTRLEINVVLAGPGRVYLSPLRIKQSPVALPAASPVEPSAPAPVGPAGTPGAWWGDRTGNLIGRIGGTIIGLLGALIGILAGAGKARRFVIAMTILITASGVVALLVGATALAMRQPMVVYAPFLLGGGLMTVLCGGLLPTIRRRYAEIELRRMTAMDVAAPGK